MTEILAHLLLFIGAVFMFIAGLGALRMPDLLTRMHATTKAGVFGAGLMLAGLALHFMEGDVTARALATIGFITLTAPVAAHAIARAGHRTGVPHWEGTIKDALREKQKREE
jgi:multicomponent Na+:H+ antiporter subunit G